MTELPDKNVESVVLQMRKRALVGFLKYNTTTERDDVDLLGWLQHLQEELMDACVYIERLKKEVAEVEPEPVKEECVVADEPEPVKKAYRCEHSNVERTAGSDPYSDYRCIDCGAPC